ncbi:MAG: UbiA prenyltransferase family protein [Ardenticatenales bacterium]|nr:UbiA prenyltransferase family protein [Ardenticatenales bacterium]
MGRVPPGGIRLILHHPYIRHLRVPFNLLLSPIYLWGVLLAEGTLRDPKFWAGYVTLHLFLYGGGTAFNSYYDKDEGPIGGMAEPPPVDRGLFWFSLLVQLLGFPLALWVGPSFTLMWLILCLAMIAYSHPSIRLKANPWAALTAVAVGQGAVGFAAGWSVARPVITSLLEPTAILGMGTTALIVTGLYIVTQSYQTKEDRERGDITLPVLLGPRMALGVALALLAIGGTVMIVGLGQRFGWGWSLALALFFAATGAGLLRWAQRFDEAQVMANFRTAMRFAAINSGGLSAFLLYHLL